MDNLLYYLLTRKTGTKIAALLIGVAAMCWCLVILAALSQPAPSSTQITKVVTSTPSAMSTSVGALSSGAKTPETTQAPSPTDTPKPTPTPAPAATATPTPESTDTSQPTDTPQLTPTTAAGPTPDRTEAQVIRVIDGDTIEATIDGQTYRIRYICIDAPEPDQFMGQEAKAANEQLVAGQTVYLEKDVSETDQYDRLLRYVYTADGVFVNARLVRRGWAVVEEYPPDTRYCDLFADRQSKAQSEGLGLWAPTATPSTPVLLRSLMEFEQSPFCVEYGCRLSDTWALSRGGTNNSFDLLSDPSVTVEVTTIDGVPEDFGFSLYDRHSLSPDDLHMIDMFLSAIHPGVPITPEIQDYIVQSTQKSVSQICQATPYDFGLLRIWAGKVLNQVVHVGKSCPE